MKEIIETAKEYLNAQLSVLPTNDKKKPALPAWKPYQSERLKAEEVDKLFNKKTVKGLGIICGAISGNLEVVDVDCKYDLEGTLWDDYRELLEDNLPDTYKKLVIAKTVNNGYHIYYRCSSIEGGIKIANREATPEESKIGDKIKGLIETRGEGNYAIAHPTPGYSFIQNTPLNIPTITPEEREIILSIAKTFDQIPEPPTKEETETIKKLKQKYPGKTSIEDYNERGDLVGLLTSEGWSIVKETSERVKLLRPGDSSAQDSGNYYKPKNCLTVFSTSTLFQPRKPYNPSQAYNILKCNGDWSKTALELGKQGYGDYKPTGNKTSIVTKLITVTKVNTISKETTVITTPGETLQANQIEFTLGDEINITTPGAEAQDETIKVIEELLKLNKRIYINGNQREYSYYLDYIFRKYGEIQKQSGELTDKEVDSFLDEVIILSSKLEPIDKDKLKKLLLKQPAIKELGISEESLSITVDRLTSTRDKEAQAKEFKKLLSEATQLQDKGETDKALELLDSKVKEVKLKAQATEFSKLLTPTSEAQIKEDEANQPDSLNTGYTIDGEELLLPAKQISVYAAPTNHGKTILLINTILNVAQRYPDKKFIFFTYEEKDTTILQYFLNTYIDINLNNSDKTNRRTLRDYFKTGSTKFISSHNLEYFNAKKEEFFRDYIEPGRILVKYVDYNSKELDLAIRYLQKKEPNIGGVFIDYFQLLNLPQNIRKNTRQDELKTICQDIGRVAVVTGLPICLAAQFNREATNLQRLHPTNIGEAGDIERIVNTLIGIWNMDKKVVLKNITDAESEQIMYKQKQRGLRGEGEGNMYVEILKSRDLPTGAYEFLSFNGNTGKVKNREEIVIKSEF